MPDHDLQGLRPCRALLAAAACLLLAACTPAPPTEVSLEVLDRLADDFDGRRISVRGTLRTHESPRHYWIEDEAYHRLALAYDGDLAVFVGRELAAIGVFHYDRSTGRRLRVETLQPLPTVRSAAVAVVIEPVAMPSRRIWGLTVADFDGDGDDDFLAAGHGRGAIDRIFYYGPDGRYTPDEFTLPGAPDRHGCAAGDVNGDGRLDIYCTAGADRGGGAHANELFLATGPPGRYERVGGDFGARDAAGRGRRAVFLRANDDALPDLYTTVWGQRDDDALNESSLFINRGGRFERFGSAASGSWGGRCLAAGDFNADGLDDLAVCHAGRGATLLMNGEDLSLRAQALPHRLAWWMALRAYPAAGGGNADLAALVVEAGAGSLQLFSGQALAAGDTSARRRIALGDLLPGDSSWLQRGVGGGCIPDALAVHDVNDDGYADMLISRIDGDTLVNACAEGDDLLLPGPSFDAYLPVPSPANGRRSQLFGANGHFLRLTAGERWEGGVEIVRLVRNYSSP
jgi:hypothetical protein